MNLGLLSAAKMVHKKVASKLGIPADQAKIKAKEEEGSSKQPGAAQGKAGELQKTKLKKSRSIKLSHSDSFKLRKQQFRWRNITGGRSSNSSKKGTQTKASEGSPPNYTKSTSSSKAKKEIVQVSPKSPITSKLKSPNDIMQPKHGSMLSSNKSPNTMMKRNSSLKPVRSLMKKNSTKALYPKQNVGRDTCSSTLKNTKFPTSLDLHPSEVEVERTSVMKVCPYTYCSLNGHHHHESLPSLKRFVSIRRGMLRAQKSMKLKGLSTTGINQIGQDEIENGIGQISVASSTAKVYPLVHEDTDFFVEIYVKPMNETTKKNPESQEEHDEIELNLSEASDTEKEDFAATVESIDELDKKVGFESKIGQETSDEVTKNSIPLGLYEFTEKDEEEAARRNQSTTEKPELKAAFNYCVGKDEQLKLQFNDSQIENSKQDGLFSNSADKDEQHSCADNCGNCKNNGDNITVAEQQSLEINHSTKALNKQVEDLGAQDLHGVSNPLPQDNHNSETASKFDVDGKEFILNEDGKDKDMKSGQSEALARASDQAVGNIKQMEATDVSKLNEKLVTSENSQALTNENMLSVSVVNQKSSISRGTQTDTNQEDVIEEEEELKKMVVPSKELVIHFEQEAHQLSPKTQHTKEVFQRTARKTIVRDESPFKEFNPRGPYFLPLEPNPETEKVDLKHQLMDERRRPEDWMLDHALQQAVGKLISGGRRRVNLLVKAFETIIPECETPLQNVTSSFPQARPIQACR